MKYLITKRDMEINHIILSQIIKIGKAIEIINNIRIFSLTNGDITKTMDFNKTTRGVFCCWKEGHVKKDCPIWKKIMKDEVKNSTSKVRVNVVMVD
jgi:hypothetical protein